MCFRPEATALLARENPGHVFPASLSLREKVAHIIVTVWESYHLGGGLWLQCVPKVPPQPCSSLRSF